MGRNIPGGIFLVGIFPGGIFLEPIRSYVKIILWSY